MKQKKIFVSSAMAFILLISIACFFSDMTSESAESIIGAYLGLLGAGAAAIAFIIGFGEFIGYFLRILTGYIADKTHKYWFMVILGYAIDVFAVPLLALLTKDGWIYACIIITIQHVGKAIKKPAKYTLISFAAQETGVGKGFAIHEFIDQLGAFIGPLMLTGILLFTKRYSEIQSYALCFALLIIPASFCILALLFAKRKFPHPELFEKQKATQKEFKPHKAFIIYLLAACFLAFGFIGFPIITLHESKRNLFSSEILPLLYSGAMLVDALAALVLGWLYDKIGNKVLIISTLLTSFFALFLFGFQSIWTSIIGIIMWGIGMGSQETILKSTLSSLTLKEHRSKSFGMFDAIFGLFAFLGGVFLGYLYDHHWLTAMIIISVTIQLLSIPILIFVNILSKQNNPEILIKEKTHF